MAKASDVKNIFLLVLIITLLALTAGLAGAQQTKKIPRIGYLGLDDPSSSLFKSFRQGLREVGYIEGQSIIIEPRFAYGNDWRLNGLAAELAGLNVNAIVTQSSPALNAARNATRTIPIVMVYLGDPVAVGIVASRERPGGNVTGVSGMTTELGGKWLELLKETVPGISRIAVLWSAGFEMEPTMKGMQATARSLGVELESAEVKLLKPPFGFAGSHGRPGSVGAAFTWATRGQAGAFVLLPSSILNDNLGYIAELALRRRLPGIFWRADFAEAGGLMSYGANEIEQSRRAAYVVDKILKGANPAELPVELPTQFKLVINLKTAKEIGVTIPPDMLMFADRVIK
jgi:putative tryptophan/tyrosine transport system substrate-binding protein